VESHHQLILAKLRYSEDSVVNDIHDEKKGQDDHVGDSKAGGFLLDFHSIHIHEKLQRKEKLNSHTKEARIIFYFVNGIVFATYLS
jgi:hypothetical protein